MPASRLITSYRVRYLAVPLLTVMTLAAWAGGDLASPAEERYPPIALSTTTPETGNLSVSGQALHYVRGGRLRSSFSARPLPIERFVAMECGVGGINAGFYADLARGAGRYMIGPLLTRDGDFQATSLPDLPRCQGRPLVLWNDGQMRIVPFEGRMGRSIEDLHRELPGATDAFLAGGWLVQEGKALSEQDIRKGGVLNAMHPRRRAALGVDGKGRTLLAATDYSVDSARFAVSITKLGVREAVLLDGGFSTALVWKGEVLVNGHSRKEMPSRDVPHALVVLVPKPERVR